ncbi:hypothetical protein B0A52_06380 [Exophiala mesophila]|uniref:NAD(P)-binding domain-containing protein n=1 Tax=Exophiala mesophila TaxID=212818 RepID=A0A438N1Y7_EXOME|nr:hypothetical protein B0A52_06380 [Exophiala mesophila]
MVGSKILVLGATGPSGINVLRELEYRKLPTVVYARTVSKIPTEISQSPYIEVIQGSFFNADEAKLSSAISQCSVIISLLGPNIGSIRGLKPNTYADIYAQFVFPLMRQHGVKRIFAMSTVSVSRPEDKPSIIRWVLAFAVWLVAGMAQKNIYTMQYLFEDQEQSKDIEWTAFRLAFIPGGHDEKSWRKDREGEVFTGYVGDPGYSFVQRRGQLGKWLVDAAVDGAPQWIHRFPAVSRLAGGKKHE